MIKQLQINFVINTDEDTDEEIKDLAMQAIRLGNDTLFPLESMYLDGEEYYVCGKGFITEKNK